MASAASASLLRVVTLPSSCSPSPSPSSLRSRHNAAAAAPKLQRGLCTVSCSANSSSSTGVAVRKAAAAAVAAAGALMVTAHPAFAVEKVAEFAGSGLIFRDSIEVVSIEDPKVEGVTIYLSDFKRNLMDKLSKDFFNEPSQASLSCAQTGPMHVTGNLRGGDGEEVYEDNKNFMNFKSIHVRRVFDKKHNALVYVTYSTRFGDDPNNKSIGKYKSSVCVVPFYSPTLASFGNEATKEAPALR